jgi:hypothetical protein
VIIFLSTCTIDSTGNYNPSGAPDITSSLLQQQFGNVDLEIIEEAKRGKDVPLLVVLYNLSSLTNDAKEALRDIEGWKFSKFLSYSCPTSACCYI